MKPNKILIALAVAGSANTYASDAAVNTQWGQIAEPAYPAAICGQPLPARLIPVNASLDTLDNDPSRSQPDTVRIQAAIDACPIGQAVKLVVGSAGESGFLSGPLKLKSGVTLWVDAGVTLFASRNPTDYDTGSGTCGTAGKTGGRTCKPFILADKTANSGVVGGGIIDGRGGSLVTSGTNANARSWWDVAYQSRSAGLTPQTFRILQIQNGTDFTLHGITLQNSPNFHVWGYGVTGLTAWGIKVLTPSLVYTKSGYQCPAGTTPDVVTPATCFTPDTAINTDGFDTGYSSKVLLAYSYISVGDDHVAIKSSSSPGAHNHSYAHNHFYYGHGLSIGSETNAGVSDIAVTDLSIDGFDSGTSGGLRIKSDSSVGGKVSNVSYSGICTRNISHPLTFDSFYSASKGSLFPSFTGIAVRDFHHLGSVKYKGGTLTFAGYALNGQNNLLAITLDNVVFDATQPTYTTGHNGISLDPYATQFTLGAGPVSFASSIVAASASKVTITGSGTGPGTARDCSTAFVPLKSVLRTSPI
ncbi:MULTISPECIES: glycoside hydrolase family 28 protein [unclassified Duganella]|uniref:glycoside hydrolase family 28 protein n=1 Tax=unclassified Duganella TaxID=2636909 RepID=UPI000E3515BC|nr:MULTISPECIES: glycosyl hydrolase family 28 protein [unclassified Duganella]RFP09187.1 polygalacturonase [Duganella sp. BJB475]RFP25413.1 polygalacturonase [Duganella sp. BJB476]